MKFQILKTNATVAVSKDTTDRLILPKKVIEMRWIHGQDWVQFVAEPNTSWKDLCRRARIAKKEFKKYLQTRGTNG
jgi:hypothetical protein